MCRVGGVLLVTIVTMKMNIWSLVVCQVHGKQEYMWLSRNLIDAKQENMGLTCNYRDDI